MPHHYELNPPASESDWQAFHDIREAVLWTARGRTGYNRRHPHDYEVPANEPMLLTVDGRPMGTMRLDNRGDGSGIVRMVAVLSTEQGKGHGRELSRLWEEAARARGMRTLYINAAETAIGYYEKLGWAPHEWDAEELATNGVNCIQMRKDI